MRLSHERRRAAHTGSPETTEARIEQVKQFHKLGNHKSLVQPSRLWPAPGAHSWSQSENEFCSVKAR